MPVIELSERETREVDRELMVDYTTQMAIEDRTEALSKVPGALEHARSMWCGRATWQKSLTLNSIARERVLPSGEFAELPEVYYWTRCPVDGLLVLFWGEDAIVEGDRVRLRMPYDPLPRYMDPEELDLLRRALYARGEVAEGDRFAYLDLS